MSTRLPESFHTANILSFYVFIHICTRLALLRTIQADWTSTMSMEALPNELVTMIVDLLETKDILSGRFVWRNFAAVGIAEFNRLYIHPTRLGGVIEMCNHAHLSKSISEIFIVGKKKPSYHLPRLSSLSLHTQTDFDDHSWPVTPPADPLNICKSSFMC